MPIDDETTFSALALLPGMQHMITLMQEQLDQLRADVTAAMNRGEEPEPRPGKENGRRGWSDDPEERKAEAKRRRDAGKLKNSAPAHPRDPRHPGHEAWLKKLRTSQKKRWDGLSPAKQKAQIRKMTKGRTAGASSARAVVEEMKARGAAA